MEAPWTAGNIRRLPTAPRIFTLRPFMTIITPVIQVRAFAVLTGISIHSALVLEFVVAPRIRTSLIQLAPETVLLLTRLFTQDVIAALRTVPLVHRALFRVKGRGIRRGWELLPALAVGHRCEHKVRSARRKAHALPIIRLREPGSHKVL